MIHEYCTMNPCGCRVVQGLGRMNLTHVIILHCAAHKGRGWGMVQHWAQAHIEAEGVLTHGPAESISKGHLSMTGGDDAKGKARRAAVSPLRP